MTGYVTAQRAAAEHGVTPRRMTQLLREGRVQGAMKFGRQWCVPMPVVVLPPLGDHPADISANAIMLPGVPEGDGFTQTAGRTANSS